MVARSRRAVSDAEPHPPRPPHLQPQRRRWMQVPSPSSSTRLSSRTSRSCTSRHWSEGGTGTSRSGGGSSCSQAKSLTVDSHSLLIACALSLVLQLDAILNSPGGQLSVSDARLLRHRSSIEKKSQLANEGEVAACIRALTHQGWIRDNPNDASATPSRRGGGVREATLCLGERSYAELRAYIEDKLKGKQCATCHQPCLLVRVYTRALSKCVARILSSQSCLVLFSLVLPAFASPSCVLLFRA